MPYSSRYGPQIAQLLLEQGDTAARREMDRGRVWGGAVQNIGQQVTGTLASLLQEKQDAPIRAHQAAKMQAEQDEMRRGGQLRDVARLAVNPQTGRLDASTMAREAAAIG